MRRASTIVFVTLALGAGCANNDGGDERARPSSRGQPPPATVVDSPDDLAVPASAAEVAETIARVERALRSPATPAGTVPRLGWEQQNGYRALGAHPEWLPEILAAVPADLQPVVAANEGAGRDLTTLAEPQPGLPDWRIEAPPAPEVLVGYYREAEAASGIPWQYLAAIHFVETRVGRIRGTSTAGAQGPMQFIPATWEAYGEGDVNDNRDAILAAGRYLADRGGPEDMDRALFAYNNSDRYVRAVQAYAAQIAAGQELVYRGYYHWQVYYATTDGIALLPEGYPDTPAVIVNATPRELGNARSTRSA